MYRVFPLPHTCRASMEFWSVEKPTETLTYTLTISAPLLPEEWLAPLEHSPSNNDEPLGELGPVAVLTVGGGRAPCSPWDTLLHYTASKAADTWSRRAQVRRARKNLTGKTATVASKSTGLRTLTNGSSVKQESSSTASELYRVVQPMADGQVTSAPPPLPLPPPPKAASAPPPLTLPPLPKAASAPPPLPLPPPPKAASAPPPLPLPPPHESMAGLTTDSLTVQNESLVKHAESARLQSPVATVTAESASQVSTINHNGPTSTASMPRPSNMTTPTCTSAEGVTQTTVNGHLAKLVSSPSSLDPSTSEAVEGCITAQGSRDGGSIPSATHISTAGSNGSLTVTPSSTFDDGAPPTVCRIVNESAVTATLLFANADTALFSSSQYEADICRVQNEPVSDGRKESLAGGGGEEGGGERQDDKIVSAAREGGGREGELEDKAEDSSSVETKGVKESEKETSEGERERSHGVLVEMKGDPQRLTAMATVEDGCSNDRGEGIAPEGSHLVQGEDRSQVSPAVTTHTANKADHVTSATHTPSSTSPSHVTVSNPMPTTPTSTTKTDNSSMSVVQSPPTTQSPPTSPFIAVYQNMTYVPYISNNHLYLYPVSPDVLGDHTPSPTHSPNKTTPTSTTKTKPQQHNCLLPRQLNEYPNQKAINKFKIPKRRRKLNSPPTSQQPRPLAPPPQASPPSQVTCITGSEDVVVRSQCLRRWEAGLPTNPFSLTYTVTTSAGHSWTTDKLEGKDR